MKEVDEEAGQAADMNEDQCALILIQRKHILDGDCTRLREELGELTTEAEDAKKNLISFKGEIEKLKVEKIRMIARMRNAQARVRIQRALEEISYDDDGPRARRSARVESSGCWRRLASITKLRAPSSRQTRGNPRAQCRGQGPGRARGPEAQAPVRHSRRWISSPQPRMPPTATSSSAN